MHPYEIEDIKKKIKKAYKKYTTEEKDKKILLSELAKFFNIPIDEKREQDYIVNKIDCNTPEIKIIDKNKGITYAAGYTGNADLLYASRPVELNRVISTSGERQEESLYYIGESNPIITKMTITEGEYELVFEREFPNSLNMFHSSRDGVKMAVRYVQNVNYDGRIVKQPLFNRIYKNKYKNLSCRDSFEQTYTYGEQNFIKREATLDKYTYIRNDSVIYGINELEQKGICHFLYGVCFENAKIPIDHYFPMNMYKKDYPSLDEDTTISAMLFIATTADDVRHKMEIYKKEDSINIRYYSEKYYPEIMPVATEELILPNVSAEKISSNEIENILSLLQEKIEDSLIFNIIKRELTTFATKIDNRKRLVQEELDPLSPKLLIDKSFDEINTLINENKNAYFSLIAEQFRNAVNISDTKIKEKTKILKPTTTNTKKP